MRGDAGDRIVVTCENKCHIDGSRTELVARYVMTEGGFEPVGMEQRWLKAP